MDNTSNVHVGLGKVLASSYMVLCLSYLQCIYILEVIFNFYLLILLIWLQYLLKVSLKEELLRENVGAFVNALLLAKPAGLKKSKLHMLFTFLFIVHGLK